MPGPDPAPLPGGLPVPRDDGAAAHLPGLSVPPIALPASDGSSVLLADFGPHERTVVYAYPRTGPPGTPELTDNWDLIPGARGCSQ